MGTSTPRQRARAQVLSLVGLFELSVAGASVPLGLNAQRLLAYLAISGGTARDIVAGELWGARSQERAAANLRTTLWRLPKECTDLVERRGSSLILSDDLSVDVADIEASANAVLHGPPDIRAAYRLVPEARLLPGWSDLWVVVERERLHMLRIEALELAAQARLDAHDPVRALEFAHSAIRAEPLRESMWRLVICAHRQLGNFADVRRVFAEYRGLLDQELGLPPSPLMLRLVAGIEASVPPHLVTLR